MEASVEALPPGHVARLQGALVRVALLLADVARALEREAARLFIIVAALVLLSRGQLLLGLDIHFDPKPLLF